jgi:hypothetical protein
LGFHLLDDLMRAEGREIDAREAALAVHLTHRQAFNVIAASGNHADDTRKYAGLVVH